MAKWRSCMETNIYDEKVTTDTKAGQELGVSGTPAFAIGLTDPEKPNEILATELIEGAYPFQAFQQVIEEMLKSKEGE